MKINQNFKSILVVFIVLLIIFALFKSFRPAPATTVVQTNYESVLKTGILRACYVSYPPSLIKDPNTNKLSGVSVEILEQATKNMGLKVMWIAEVGWGEMIESLNSNKCDVIGSAIWGNSNRGKSSEFTVPLYYSAINAYVRSNDNRFNENIELINNKEYTLATIDGSTPQLIASRYFPNARTLELPQNSDISQLLMNVATGKADITFVEPTIALQYEKNNPGKLKNISLSKPIAVYADVMLVKKGEFALKSALDSALTELINSGFVDRSIDAYEKKFPGGFYRVATPYVVPHIK